MPRGGRDRTPCPTADATIDHKSNAGRGWNLVCGWFVLAVVSTRSSATTLSILRRYPDFSRMWVGDTVSNCGSAVSGVAVPLLAVVLLHDSPLEMGILGAMGVLPHLIIGLPAGVWVERMSYRRWLIVADSSRAVLFAAVALLAGLGPLQMWQLYVVTVLAGVATLFDSLSSTSFVPQLVRRDDLLAANAASTQSSAAVSVAGSSLGGALVQLLTAPVAIAIDACSFAASAWISGRIKMRERAHRAREHDQKFWQHIWEGVRVVFDDPLLRPLLLAAGVGALFGQIQNVVIVLYLSRQLDLPAVVIGLAFTISGIAAFAGALFARTITRQVGHGRAFMCGQVSVAVGGLMLAAVGGPLLILVTVLVAAQVLRGVGPPVYSVNQSTIRQSLTRPEVLARVNATWRFLVFGTQPIGALVGGLLGGMIGLRATIVTGSLGIIAATGFVARSPLRTLKAIPRTA